MCFFSSFVHHDLFFGWQGLLTDSFLNRKIFKSKIATNNVVVNNIILTLLKMPKCLNLIILTTLSLTKVHAILTKVHELKINLRFHFKGLYRLKTSILSLLISHKGTCYPHKSTPNSHRSTRVIKLSLTKVHQIDKVLYSRLKAVNRSKTCCKNRATLTKVHGFLLISFHENLLLKSYAYERFCYA